MTLTLGYAIAGVIDLVNREDPIINENVIKDYYTVSNGESLDLKQGNQAFAIQIVDYNAAWYGGSIYIMDPSYIRIMAEIKTETSETYIPVRKCTEEDLNKFYTHDE